MASPPPRLSSPLTRLAARAGLAALALGSAQPRAQEAAPSAAQETAAGPHIARVIQTGHTGPLTRVEGANGRVLTVGRDGTARLWHPAERDAQGTLLRSFLTPGAKLVDAALSPDGERVALLNASGELSLRRASDGQALPLALATVGRRPQHVAFAGRGRLLVLGSGGGDLVAYAIAGDQESPAGLAPEVQIDVGAPIAALLGNDAGLVAVSDREGGISLWDLSTGEQRLGRSSPAGTAARIALDATSDALAWSTGNNQVHLWRGEGGRESMLPARGQVRGLALRAGRLAVSWLVPDAKGAQGPLDAPIAVGRRVGVSVYDLRTGQEIPFADSDAGCTPGSLPSPGCTSPTALAFSPGVGSVIVGYQDGTARVHPLKLAGALPGGSVFQGLIAPLGAAWPLPGRLLTLGRGGAWQVWDPGTGQIIGSGALGAWRSASINPERGLIWTLDPDHQLAGTQISDGRRLAVPPLKERPSGPIRVLGDALVYASDPRTVQVWDPLRGALTSKVRVPPWSSARPLAMASDGARLLTASWRKLTIWDTRSHPFLAPRRAAKQKRWTTWRARAAAFSPDNDRVAVSNASGRIQIFDVRAGARHRPLATHAPLDPQRTQGLAWSPDGAQIARGTTSGFVEIFAPDGSPVSDLRLPTGGLVDLQFAQTPGGPLRLLTLDSEGVVSVWDPSRGEALGQLAVLPDGGWVVADRHGRYDQDRLRQKGAPIVVTWPGAEDPSDRVIESWQLDKRAWRPGLLSALFTAPEGEPHPAPITAEDLPPSVSMRWMDEGQQTLVIDVRSADREGALGGVELSLNGRRLPIDLDTDALDGLRREQSSGQVWFRVDLPSLRAAAAAHTPPFLVPDRIDAVSVQAWAASNRISAQATWGIAPTIQSDPSGTHVWGIFAGVSDYVGASMDLQAPAGDAAALYSLTEAAALDLLTPEQDVGVRPERLHFTLLNNGPRAQEGSRAPTQQAIQEAIQAASASDAKDLFVLFLSGHGLSRQGEYYYLTAAAGDPASLREDEALPDDWAISSEELAAWLQNVPAQRQVVVLDTCEAGGALPQLASWNQRASLLSLQDEMGLYLLAGASTSAVSFESTWLNHGLLSYALIEGLSGAVPREDARVFVDALLSYAQRRVPELAAQLNLHQQPVTAVPSAAVPFPVGSVGKNVSVAVETLGFTQLEAGVAPAQLQDEHELQDRLMLGLALDDALAARSGTGQEGLRLERRADAPGVRYLVAGRYRVEPGEGGDRLYLRLDLRRKGAPLSFASDLAFEGSADDLDGFAACVAGTAAQWFLWEARSDQPDAAPPTRGPRRCAPEGGGAPGEASLPSQEHEPERE